MRIEVSVVGIPVDGQPSTRGSVAQETDRSWEMELDHGATVEVLIRRLRLQEAEIESILVNGKHADRYTVLDDGDGVAFAGVEGE